MDLQVDLTIEVNRIDFILGDERWKAKDCDLVVQILYPIIHSSVQERSDRQQQKCLQSVSSWRMDHLKYSRHVKLSKNIQQRKNLSS